MAPFSGHERGGRVSRTTAGASVSIFMYWITRSTLTSCVSASVDIRTTLHHHHTVSDGACVCVCVCGVLRVRAVSVEGGGERERRVPVEHAGDAEGVGERETGHTRIDVVPLQHGEQGGQGHHARACG